jgi:hypothetical protein
LRSYASGSVKCRAGTRPVWRIWIKCCVARAGREVLLRTRMAYERPNESLRCGGFNRGGCSGLDSSIRWTACCSVHLVIGRQPCCGWNLHPVVELASAQAARRLPRGMCTMSPSFLLSALGSKQVRKRRRWFPGVSELRYSVEAEAGFFKLICRIQYLIG